MSDTGNPTPKPDPRRTPGKAEGIRISFRSTEVEAAPPAADLPDETALFRARAMRPDGTPASRPPKSTRKAKAMAKAKAEKPHKSTWIPVTFLVLLAAVVGLGLYAFITDPARSNTYFEGVYVGGVHLGGLDKEQASAALSDAQAQILAAWRVALRYEDAEKNLAETTILADDIGMQMNLGEHLAEAWKQGREGSYTERKQAVAALRSAPYQVKGGVTFDAGLLEVMLEQLRSEIDREPVDATADFAPESEQPFRYTDESNGRQLDVDALQSLIKEYASTLQSADITLEPKTVLPKVTRAGLEANLTCIVVVTTDIHSTSTEGRNDNIRIALGHFNGMSIAPSERISFNSVVGKRSDPANGYKEALEIAYGEYVTGVGGGVCQVSTTLYQAVLRSGLQVMERSPHAIPSNYAERGQDATVSDNGIDFVFRNNTGYPVYIRARLTESDDKNPRKRCEIAIYGRPLPSATRYTLESTQIGADIPPDTETEYRADREAAYVTYTDEQHEYLPVRLGHRIETYRVTLGENGLETDRERISEDLYSPRPAQIYVGVTPRN